jgi:twitching motility two-component system response regulator PilG
VSSDSEGPSVIIIDSSRLTRVIVDVCLRREGIPCIGFPDAAPALQALQADPELVPRVIVLELAFPSPGIDGYALIRLLRVSARLDKTAIIVLTSQSGPVSHLRARLAGANDFLAKPFVREQFLSALSPYFTPTQEQAHPSDQRPSEQEPRLRGDRHHATSNLRPGSAEGGARRYAS